MKRPYVLIMAILSVFSCTEEERDTSFADFGFQEEIDRIILDAGMSTGKGELTYTWHSSNNCVNIETSSLSASQAFFKHPSDRSVSSVDITLRVTDSQSSSETSKTISVPFLSQVRAFGLGRELEKEFSNDVGYEWYFDQRYTGEFSSINCGPTSVTIAAKWALKDFSKSPEDARNTYRALGGSWYTSDMVAYLSDHQISNHIVELEDMRSMITEIDAGNIFILCLDMFYVSYNPDKNFRFGRFFTSTSSGTGHFIVVKGYKIVDGITYFEVYDPLSNGRRYSDGTPKGKNRYYTSEDLDMATNEWWDYAIVVSKNNNASRVRKIDPSTIIHKSGD